MESICGADCNNCEYGKNNNCKGCIKTKGCPFGSKCFVADYILTGGKDNFETFKSKLIDEINSLDVPGMPKINELVPLNGSFVNLEYLLPNGKKVKFLNDNEIYLGTQVESMFNDENLIRCFGVLVNMSFILICEYGPNGENPELIIYKKR